MQNEYHDAPEDYEFIQEKIKDQDTKAQMRRGLPKIIGAGLLFGICASFTFTMMNPVMNRFFSSKAEEVTIQAEESTEEPSDIQVELPEEPETTEPVEVKVDMELKHYKQLQQLLISTSRDVAKSIVTVTGITDDDLAGGTFYDNNSVSGVIIADNHRELLILARTSVSKKGDEIDITFFDSRTYKAAHKKAYSQLGLSIYSVNKADLSEKTLDVIQVAQIAPSNSVKKGDTIICVGSPFGYEDSTAFGTASNLFNTISRTDGEYRLISSDLVGTTSSTGVFADLEGRIVAVVDGSISEETGCPQLFGYEINSIVNVIETLSNGKDFPYTGINGYTVTERMFQSGIPAGIYVDSVVTDSPAMEAGIQSGDVITSINHASVSAMSSYQKYLGEATPGDEITLVGMRFGKKGYKQITYKVTCTK
ncbi:MAG: S1C family serine protease [Dorea sp.]|nr:S1C family serine protease [Dorea sp.]